MQHMPHTLHAVPTIMNDGFQLQAVQGFASQRCLGPLLKREV